VDAVRITIKSRLEEVREIGAGVLAFCLGQGLSSDEAGLVELAVVEAANNAVIHAYAGSPNGKIEVNMERTADKLVFSVSDWGESFDPGPLLARLGPAWEQDPLEESGRGLAIIKQVMERIEHRSTDGRNTMVMVRPGPGL